MLQRGARTLCRGRVPQAEPRGSQGEARESEKKEVGEKRVLELLQCLLRTVQNVEEARHFPHVAPLDLDF